MWESKHLTWQAILNVETGGNWSHGCEDWTVKMGHWSWDTSSCWKHQQGLRNTKDKKLQDLGVKVGTIQRVAAFHTSVRRGQGSTGSWRSNELDTNRRWKKHLCLVAPLPLWLSLHRVPYPNGREQKSRWQRNLENSMQSPAPVSRSKV